MQRTSVGKYHIRQTRQALTIGFDMEVIGLLVPSRHVPAPLMSVEAARTDS